MSRRPPRLYDDVHVIDLITELVSKYKRERARKHVDWNEIIRELFEVPSIAAKYRYPRAVMFQESYYAKLKQLQSGRDASCTAASDPEAGDDVGEVQVNLELVVPFPFPPIPYILAQARAAGGAQAVPQSSLVSDIFSPDLPGTR